MLTTQVGGVGLNLVQADRVIICMQSLLSWFPSGLSFFWILWSLHLNLPSHLAVCSSFHGCVVLTCSRSCMECDGWASCRPRVPHRPEAWRRCVQIHHVRDRRRDHLPQAGEQEVADEDCIGIHWHRFLPFEYFTFLSFLFLALFYSSSPRIESSLLSRARPNLIIATSPRPS